MTKLPFYRTLASVAVVSALLTACDTSDPQQQAISQTAQNVLMPTYSQWAGANHQLEKSAEQFCTDKQTLDEAQQTWRSAQLAWAELQPMAIGPLSEGNLAWQVQFWPDKKNLVGRQIQALLKKSPDLTLEQLQRASVVVQGLSAYEYVLFDESVDLADPATKAAYCPLLTAIGQHQAKLAGGVLAQWQNKNGMLQQLEKFPNDRYIDASEALTDLFRVQVGALDGLKKKLAMPIGRLSKGHPQPLQAESWRSDNSLRSMTATIHGAKQVWQSAFKPLLDASQGDLSARIDNAYVRTLEMLTQLDQPLAIQLNSEKGRAALEELYGQIDRLHRLQQNDLARALNIQVGFNAHDGD